MLNHAFKIHSVAFVMMIVSSAGLYFAARGGAFGWIFGLLTLFIIGNILALMVK